MMSGQELQNGGVSVSLLLSKLLLSTLLRFSALLLISAMQEKEH